MNVKLKGKLRYFLSICATYLEILLSAILAVALLICALRVLAGAHYVRDVAAGALLGFALGAAGMYLL